jgi:hypothetical protein
MQTYKGFDLYPLVYKHEVVRAWGEEMPDRSYDAAVMICREGHNPGTEHSRVFRYPAAPWQNVGTARRGVMAFAEKIIDGMIPGESVASL